MLRSGWTSVGLFFAVVHGYPSYRDHVPNGKNVACPPGASGCERGMLGQPESVCNGLGHASCSGGSMPLNAFGNAFIKANREWTKELCQEDSDGDGFTNGQELGDPCCVWTQWSDPSNYTASFKATHPGMNSSKPPGYSAPSCSNADTAPKAELEQLAAFNEGEEQRSVDYIIKDYELPRIRTEYVDFVFNFDDEDHDIYHIVYGEALVHLRKHLHHFVVTGCTKKVDATLVGMPTKKPDFCNEQVGGFAGWAPGVTMWENPVSAGTAIGKGVGIVAFSINVHFTDADLVEETLKSRDGIRIFYTPTLRPKQISSTPVINLGLAPIWVPAGQRRAFITRECTVASSCRNGWSDEDCDDAVAKKYCDLSYDVKSKACPKACGHCSEILPANVMATYYHAHLLGREMYATLQKKESPDTIVDLNSQSKWHYDNQATYFGLNQTLEAGDKLQVTCVFDSTERSKSTKIALETVDEMCIISLISILPTSVNVPLWGAFSCAEQVDQVWQGVLSSVESGLQVQINHPKSSAKKEEVFNTNILNMVLPRDNPVEKRICNTMDVSIQEKCQRDKIDCLSRNMPQDGISEKCRKCVQTTEDFSKCYTRRRRLVQDDKCVDYEVSQFPKEAATIAASINGCKGLAQAAGLGITCDTDLSKHPTVQNMAPGLAGNFRMWCCASCKARDEEPKDQSTDASASACTDEENALLAPMKQCGGCTGLSTDCQDCLHSAEVSSDCLPNGALLGQCKSDDVLALADLSMCGDDGECSAIHSQMITSLCMTCIQSGKDQSQCFEKSARCSDADRGAMVRLAMNSKLDVVVSSPGPSLFRSFSPSCVTCLLAHSGEIEKCMMSELSRAFGAKLASEPQCDSSVVNKWFATIGYVPDKMEPAMEPAQGGKQWIWISSKSEGDSWICHAGTQVDRTATYTDPKDNKEANCGDAEFYCSNGGECGSQTEVRDFMRNSKCCI